MDEPTLLFSFLITLHLSLSGINSTTFTIVNKCNFTVWPAAVARSDNAVISPSGFVLQTDESRAINAPTPWVGSIWGRTGCKLDSTGKFSCATGDCGSGRVECDGFSSSPTTVAEFTLASFNNLDFFALSLLYGYNLPFMVVPGGPSGTKCTSVGCVVDVNGECPPELKVYSDNEQDDVVACKSACVAFNSSEYCCNGYHSTREACSPTSYSQFFKTACPRAYIYAFEVKDNTWTCSSADYILTFCPVSKSRQKWLQSDHSSSSLLVTNGKFVQ